LQFIFRDFGWRTVKADKSNDPSQLKYVKTFVQGNANKYIAGKKWKQDKLFAVFPSVDFSTYGQKSLDMSLTQLLGHCLLMSGTCIYGVPGWDGDSHSLSCFLFKRFFSR